MKISRTEIRTVAELHKSMQRLWRKPKGTLSAAELIKIVSNQSDEYDRARKTLLDFLNGLEYTKIVELEVLMSFGREWYQHESLHTRNLDYDDDDYYDEDEALEDDFQLDLRDCFADFVSYLHEPKGKDIAIDYLIGKLQLGEYLYAALEHCNPDRYSLPFWA